MNDSGGRAVQLAVNDDFENWMHDRPQWLQTAAKKIIESKRLPNDEEIAVLAKLCQSEVLQDNTADFLKIDPGSLELAAVRPSLRIDKIQNVQGIAAIKNGAEIDFGPHNLTVIYGVNGAGKTGFSRLLKQVSGSKSKDDIYSNVFEDNSPPTSAQLKVSLAGVSHEIDWCLQDGAVAQLRNLHVFDSKTASMYVVEKNEASYEPSRMRFISSLIKVCDKVVELINVEKNKLVKALPQFPAEFCETAAGKWFGRIKANLSIEEIEATCTVLREKVDERITLEGNLAQKDVVGRVVAIGRERTALLQLQQYFFGIKEKLSDQSLSQLVDARSSAFAKRKAANEDAKKVFAGAQLNGIGNASWRELWAQARIFSLNYAYPDALFPNVAADAKCVLCNQKLDADAEARLKHFEDFVQSGLEASAKEAEGRLETLVRRLPIIATFEEWQVQIAILKLTEEVFSPFYNSLLSRKNSAETAVEFAKISPLNWSDCDDALSGILEKLMVEEKTLVKLQQDGSRKEMVGRVLALRATEWLGQNKEAIKTEVTRLVTIAILEKSISLASTMNLTKKNNELAKSELSAGYQARFAEELKKLGGDRLKVIPESKQQGKGKTIFGIVLKDAKKQAPAERILSEGEMRIVALAAFLADITGSSQITPFIFDDPISSLDQNFEERVVQRLMKLAETRQVIIFTHRLSLLALVDSEIKKIKDASELLKKAPAVELHVETLRRMGSIAGLRVKFSVRDAKPKQAIKRFQTDIIPELKRLFEQLDEKYDHYVKGVCSDLRILVERSVESVLLNDVVVRFRRAVQTQGRLGALAKIDSSDCELIDDLMTRYSVFEHSQADELPADVPDLKQIETDVENLARWIENFPKRAVTR